MTQRERREVTDRIMDYCRTTPGIWAVKIHADSVQGVGIPDIVGCVDGRFFACEAKVKGKNPTKIQRHTLDLVARAGGLAIVAHSLEEFMEGINGKEA